MIATRERSAQGHFFFPEAVLDFLEALAGDWEAVLPAAFGATEDLAAGLAVASFFFFGR